MSDAPIGERVHSGAASTASGRASELTEILTAEILQGKQPAGAPLRQNQLAARFDVSRTPVREALHRLVAVGLATFQPNAGFRVRRVSQAEYLEAMQIRSRLEGLAAARAVSRVTVRQLTDLMSIAEELDDTGRRLSDAGARESYVDDQNRWSQKNAQFHDLLVQLAECPPLAVAMATTVRAYPREVTWLAAERFPGLLNEYAADHYAICEALQAGDAELARARAQTHVERAIKYLQLVFNHRDGGSALDSAGAATSP
jgi:DNA-binding GntR family transcriptional regulator